MWTDFLAIMERKDVVRPACALQDAMRSGLAFDGPASTRERGQNAALWWQSIGSCRLENVCNFTRQRFAMFKTIGNNAKR
jgi:hypothetical protein